MPKQIIETLAKTQIVKLIVAEEFNVSVKELEGSDRSRRVVHPRAIAMRIIYQETRVSSPQIGKAFGNRDHTTVLHAISKVDQYCAQDLTSFAGFRAVLDRFQNLTQTRELMI